MQNRSAGIQIGQLLNLMLRTCGGPDQSRSGSYNRMAGFQQRMQHSEVRWCCLYFTIHEIRRITTDSVLVIQSTYNGALSQLALKFREFFLGRFGFYLARSAGLVSSGECPLVPHHYFTIEELLTLFASAGFHVCRMQSEESPIFAVSRTLFILKHNDLKE